jgi:peptidoglycan/LPS O-acetylase OafA/YrhL
MLARSTVDLRRSELTRGYGADVKPRNAPTVLQAGELRIRRLESVRALAALAVLESHAWGWHNGYGPTTTDSFFHRFLTAGDFGVNVFFTLTGFLLFSAFAREITDEGQRVDLRRYFQNRALRILPLYYFVVLVCLPIAGRAGLWQQWLTFFGFAENYSRATFLQVDPPMWSLAVEVQFYVLLPVLTWMFLTSFGRRPRILAAILLAAGVMSAVLSFVYVPWGSTTAPLFLQRSMFINFNFFAAGMLLALGSLMATGNLAERRFVGSSNLWFTLSIPIFALGIADFRLIPVTALATMLLVGGAGMSLRPGVVTSVLDTRVLAGLGVISYSLYLWHHPIVKEFAGLRPFQSFPVLLLASLAVCIPLAFASYTIVEAPFLRLRRRWARRSPVPDGPSAASQPQPASA